MQIIKKLAKESKVIEFVLVMLIVFSFDFIFIFRYGFGLSFIHVLIAFFNVALIFSVIAFPTTPTPPA